MKTKDKCKFEPQQHKSLKLECCIARRKTTPQDCRVVVERLADPLYPHQRRERQINHVHLFGQVSRVQTVIGRPCDWASAENIQRQANGQPQRRDFNATRRTAFFERWFHTLGSMSGSEHNTKPDRETIELGIAATKTAELRFCSLMVEEFHAR